MIIFFEDYTNYHLNKVDEAYWRYVVAGHGFGNAEEQFYTNRLDNLFIDKDGLHIVAKKEEYMGRHYTSARITLNKLFKYGKVSFKIKLPKNKGTWPAIWLLSEDIINRHNWPECGEIDIMEFIGKMPGKIHTSLHCKKYNHLLGNHRTKVIDINDEEFHEFVYYWTKDGFSIDIDGNHYDLFKRSDVDDYESWPFDQKYFLIMNMAVGGYFPGTVDPNFSQDEFIVKYLKIETIEDKL